MKILKNLNESEYFEKLKIALSKFGQVQIKQTTTSTASAYPSSDAQLTLSLADGDYLLHLTFKSLAEPSRVKAWLEADASPYQKNSRVYRVLAAPFLSEEAIRLCNANGVGAVDLEGNISLNVGGLSLLHTVEIRRRKRDLPQTSSQRSLAPVGVQRVAIGLLEAGRRAWKMQTLAEYCQVSVGQAFNVSQWLVDQNWAEKPARGQFRLTQPEALLNALARAYEIKEQKTFGYFTLADQHEVENTLSLRADMAHQRAVLAGFSAAEIWAPFVRHLRTQFYIQGRPHDIAASSHFKLEPADKGANVLLTIPANDTPFVFAQAAGQRTATGLIQTYLDLIKEPMRGEEAAGKVRERWLETYYNSEPSHVD